MKTGWKPVARLGTTPPGYPHLLVDPHGWCLRLGPDSRKDDKYYSRLTTLLEGMIEQGLRRRLIGAAEVVGIEQLSQAVIKTLAAMTELGRRLEILVQESPIRQAVASERPGETSTVSTFPQALPVSFKANVGA